MHKVAKAFASNVSKLRALELSRLFHAVHNYECIVITSLVSLMCISNHVLYLCTFGMTWRTFSIEHKVVGK